MGVMKRFIERKHDRLSKDQETLAFKSCQEWSQGKKDKQEDFTASDNTQPRRFKACESDEKQHTPIDLLNS